MSLPQVEARLCAAFKTADARSAMIDRIPAENPNSVANLIVRAVALSSDERKNAARDIENSLTSAIADVVVACDLHEAHAKDLQATADFIEGACTIDAIKDAELAALAQSVSLAAQLPSFNCKGEISQIRGNAAAALSQVDSIRSKMLPQAKSAAKIVVAKARLKAAGGDERAEVHMSYHLKRLKEHHRATFKGAQI